MQDNTRITAQGGGGSFRDRTPQERWIVVMHGMDGRANPLMDRKVDGVVFFGVVAMVAMVAVVTSPTTAGCSVV